MSAGIRILFLFPWFCAASAMGGDTWPAFHNGGNASVEAGDLPLRWSPDEGIAWSVELPGYGQSAPVVWKDRVYVTCAQGDPKVRLRVVALDAQTGMRIWARELAATVQTENGNTVSRAAPTPLADEEGLYVLFESGDLFALTHAGELRWRTGLFDEDENAFQNRHGYGASPAQTKEAVIVLVDHQGPSYLLALSKTTGKPLWKTERAPRSSWSSPKVTRVAEREQVIVSSNGTVDGYDAQTGRRLWSCEGISGNTIPSATVVGDRVYVGAGVGRGESGESAAASNCCLRIAPETAEGYEVLWKAENAVCSYMSPLVHRGCVYYVNSVGVVYCLDAETGQEHYAKRLGGACWAQPIGAGNRVYFFEKNGQTIVLRAGAEFEKLATNRWEAPFAAPEAPASPAEKPAGEHAESSGGAGGYPQEGPVVYGAAAVDGAIFIRLGERLVCVCGEL